jgi:hypothetical protein
MQFLPKQYLRYKWFILAGVSAVFFLLVILAFVLPTIFDIKNKIDQTDAMNAKNQILQTKIQVLDSLVLNDLQDKYKLVNIGLLQNRDPFYVLSMFDNFTSKIDQKNIDLGNISYSVGEIKEKQTKTDDLVFSQSVSGKIDSVNDFVNLVEKSFPLMSVKSVSGQYDGNSPMMINFSLYIYPEVKQIPSIDSPLTAFSSTELKLFDEISPFASVFANSASEEATDSASVVTKSGKTNPFVE